ncbi:MAG: hypothetical protein GXY19_12115 [Phycisphaerae bacterium]|nr:hypothetical protein [Phycisphaerae bacterium]
MIDAEKYVYEVVCGNNPEHVFPLISDIPLQTGDSAPKQETYCGSCDAFVRVTVRRELTQEKRFVRRPMGR